MYWNKCRNTIGHQLQKNKFHKHNLSCKHKLLLSLTIIIFNDSKDVAIQELYSREVSRVSIGTVHLQVDDEALI